MSADRCPALDSGWPNTHGTYQCVGDVGHPGNHWYGDDRGTGVPAPTPPEVRMCEGCIPWCGANCAGKPPAPVRGLDFTNIAPDGKFYAADVLALNAQHLAALEGVRKEEREKAKSDGYVIGLQAFTNGEREATAALRQEIERLTAERDAWKREAEFLMRSGNAGTEQYVRMKAALEEIVPWILDPVTNKPREVEEAARAALGGAK